MTKRVGPEKPASTEALAAEIAKAAPPVLDAPPPKHVFIISGGIGAGKSRIVDRLKTDFHFISGSPADILKESYARAIAREYNLHNTGTDSDEGWGSYFDEMLDQRTKAEYRLGLQGFGEFFSNRDGYFWANRCVDVAATQYQTFAAAGIQSGIVFDSMRRPTEILAVKTRWPQAAHIRLHIDRERQWDYLTRVLGYPDDKAEQTLAHSSEHWLDDMDGTNYDAQYVLDANGGDEKTWVQLMGVVILMMKQPELELAAAITEEEGTSE